MRCQSRALCCVPGSCAVGETVLDTFNRQTSPGARSMAQQTALCHATHVLMALLGGVLLSCASL